MFLHIGHCDEKKILCGLNKQKLIAMATSLEGLKEITSECSSTAEVLPNLQIS